MFRVIATRSQTEAEFGRGVCFIHNHSLRARNYTDNHPNLAFFDAVNFETPPAPNEKVTDPNES